MQEGLFCIEEEGLCEGTDHSDNVSVIDGDDGDRHHLTIIREHLSHTSLVAKDSNTGLECVRAHNERTTRHGLCGEGGTSESTSGTEGGGLPSTEFEGT